MEAITGGEHAHDESSGFLKKTIKKVKKAGKKIGKVGKKSVRVAKAVAKNKVIKEAWRTAPAWSQAIPPPWGQAISSGVQTANTTAEIVKLAKGGNKKAQKVVARAKELKDTRTKQAKAMTKTAKATRGKPPAKRKTAIQTTANQTGLYLVTSPAGRKFRFTPKQLRA